VNDVVVFRWIMTIPKPLSPDAFARLRICQKCVCVSSQRSPETPNWIWGRRFGARRGMGGQEWEGKARKQREGKAGQKRGRAPETAYSR